MNFVRLLFFVAACLVAAMPSLAADRSLQISGAMDMVSGLQYDSANAALTGGRLGGLADFEGSPTIGNGSRTVFAVPASPEFELGLRKEMGDRVYFRTDLDFGNVPRARQTGNLGFHLEQAILSFQWGEGRRWEGRIGRFSSFAGIESIDSRENWLISWSPPFRFLLPTELTGFVVRAPLSEFQEIRIAVTNDLNADGLGDSPLPSAIARWDLHWGREGFLGITIGLGPEADRLVIGNLPVDNGHLDLLGVMSLQYSFSQRISLQTEGVWRHSDSLTGGGVQKALAGYAALQVRPGETWDLTGRFGFETDLDPAGGRNGVGSGSSLTGGNWNGGFQGTLLSGTLGGGVQIADGARVKIEYRLDATRTLNLGVNSISQSLLTEIVYSF